MTYIINSKTVVGNPFDNQYSMLFDGANEAFNTSINEINITSSITVSAWFKIVDTVGTLQEIVCHDRASSIYRSWGMVYRGSAGTRSLNWSVFNTSGALVNTNTITTPGVTYFEDGNWHHAFGTYDGTTNTDGMKLLIDGTHLITNTATSTGIRTFGGGSSGLGIGALSGVNNWFLGGNINQIGVWQNEVLTQAQGVEIYNKGVPRDLSPYNPYVYLMPGDATFSSQFTWEDRGSLATTATSINMESGDKVLDVPT